MAPKIKLIYVNAKALAEPVRFLFAIGNIEYEDFRMSHEDFRKDKSPFPYNKIPNIEIDGVRYHQSMSITRYFARQMGLAGTNPLEELKCDVTVDTLADYRLLLVGYFYDADESSKQRKKEVALKETVPFYLTRLQDQVKNNGGYFVNGKLTWADLVFVGVQDYLNYMAGYDLLKDYPLLKQLEAKVYDVPAIKAWVAKRPNTEM